MQEKLVMLIVDDAEVNRASLGAMFMDEYKVLLAPDGQEAMQILHREKVDVVILDVFMPGLSGGGVLEQMRADGALREIPVIVKTAIDENTELEMLEKGADDFIFSPCEPAIIKNRVRNIVQRHVYRQKALQKQIREEQHAGRVRQRFIGRIADMMRREIAEIQRLCREEKETETLKERMDAIDARASNLITIVDKMADQEEMGHGEQRPHPFFFRMSRVRDEVEKEYRRLCAEKNIDFVMEEGEIPHNDLFGDARQLKKGWCRMLKKVYDNTPPGGSIRTGFGQRKTGTNQIELKITVHGNVDPNEGYPVTKSMIELLHGSLVIRDEDGRGMLCVITLPFRTGRQPVIHCKRLCDLKVLVVDDDEVMRQRYALIMTRLGISCEVVAGSAEAAGLLCRNYETQMDCDICFFNWYMLGAKQTIREIRSLIPRENMLIVCATDEKEKVEQEMKKAGVDYILERPVYQGDIYHFLTDICKEQEA